MKVKYKYTWRERLGMVAAVLVVFFILYRIALVYELVPKELTPVELLKREYKEFKIILLERSGEEDGLGKVSKITLNVMLNFEHHFVQEEQDAKEAAKSKTIGN